MTTNTLDARPAPDVEARLAALEAASPASYRRLEGAVADIIASYKIQESLRIAAASIASAGIDVSHIERAVTERAVADAGSIIRAEIGSRISGFANASDVASISRSVDTLSTRISALRGDLRAEIAASEEARSGAGSMQALIRSIERRVVLLEERSAAMNTVVAALSERLAALESSRASDTEAASAAPRRRIGHRAAD
ncbi:hypothetical protein [Falsiroseomonas sp. CW058]|uniref:hypothetical protein n=1 Tax=Falsiroseomonas sp. CW058 TaxID=3388664 RepID=UPI003D31C2C9